MQLVPLTRFRLAFAAALLSCGFRPAETPEVPAETPFERSGLQVCESWAARKLGECRESLMDSQPPEEAAASLRPVTLYEQCRWFAERRMRVSRCLEKEDCEAFAQCSLELAFDAWTPPPSAELCDAMVARRQGPARHAVDALANQVTDAVNRRTIRLQLHQLHGSCLTDEPTRMGVLDCMQENDERFVACLLELAATQP